MVNYVLVINEKTHVSGEKVFNNLPKFCNYCTDLSVNDFSEEQIAEMFSPELNAKIVKEDDTAKCTIKTSDLRAYISGSLRWEVEKLTGKLDMLDKQVKEGKETADAFYDLTECAELRLSNPYGLRFHTDGGGQFPEGRFLYFLLCCADDAGESEIAFYITQIFDYSF